MSPPTPGRSTRTPWRLFGGPAAVGAGRNDPAGPARDPGTVRIAVDLLGGDAAPDVVVDGALRALYTDPDLHVLLVGPPEAADRLIHALPPAQRGRASVRAIHDGVGMADHPVRGRRRTSVAAAVSAVAERAADALVSAGPTGATVTAAALGLGRWPGVRRPALAATVPSATGPVTLLDVGGSLEARPATLARHAVLGAAYCATAHGVGQPRVGLLSVGTEAGKGDRVRRSTEPLLDRIDMPGGARYVGLVEGYDVPLGARADVVVTDGFTGNVLLKAVEAAYATAGGPPGTETFPRAAALVGLAGTVVVCHGAARGEDLASGIGLAAQLCRLDATSRIRAMLARTASRRDTMTDTEVSA